MRSSVRSRLAPPCFLSIRSTPNPKSVPFCSKIQPNPCRSLPEKPQAESTVACTQPRVSDIVEQLRARPGEVIELLQSRPRLPGIAPMPMPPGVRLIGWNLKDPPIAIDVCSVVMDPATFVNSTLNRLQTALTGNTNEGKCMARRSEIQGELYDRFGSGEDLSG